jgi:hypothetical protein
MAKTKAPVPATPSEAGPLTDEAGAAPGIFEAIRDIVTEQCTTPEVQTMVFRPLLRWFLWNMLPYVALFIGINFFTTIGAMCLVMLLESRKRGR